MATGETFLLLILTEIIGSTIVKLCCIGLFNIDVLLIPGWRFVRLSNRFAFHKTDCRAITIRYGWSEICSQSDICFCMPFPSDIMRYNHYIQFFISTYSINFVLHTNAAPLSYGYKIPPITSIWILLRFISLLPFA